MSFQQFNSKTDHAELYKQITSHLSLLNIYLWRIMRKIINAIDSKIVQIAAASEITLLSINKPVMNIPAIRNIERTSNIFIFIFNSSFVFLDYIINDKCYKTMSKLYIFANCFVIKYNKKLLSPLTFSSFYDTIIRE